MRIKDETMHEALLGYAREIAAQHGTHAINIRELARMAGVAVGTVYNYFQSKEEILLALTEEYWRAELALMHKEITAQSFTEQICQIYSFLQARMEHSALELMASLSSVQPQAHERMEHMQDKLRAGIIRRISADEGINNLLWTQSYTQKAFADFVVINIIAHLRMGEPDISFFAKTLEKILYV